jgi:hypothetical protein
MDWNVFMPFIGFGGAAVICGLIFKLGAYYKSNEYEIKSLNYRIKLLEDKIEKEREKNKQLEVENNKINCEILKLKTFFDVYKK